MKEEDLIIQHMLLSDIAFSDTCAVIKKKYPNVVFAPKTLGMLFERYAGLSCKKIEEKTPEDCVTREITVAELILIHPSFKSTNGCRWAKVDDSYLGRRYNVVHVLKDRRLYSIRLTGKNTSAKRYRARIPAEAKILKDSRCAVLDTSSRIELDHKDARHIKVADSVSDFQPLNKTVNDVKREHCRKCLQSGIRYDAKRLGYSVSFISGDVHTKECPGCYWYDPRQFNAVVSRGFVARDKT